MGLLRAAPCVLVVRMFIVPMFVSGCATSVGLVFRGDGGDAGSPLDSGTEDAGAVDGGSSCTARTREYTATGMDTSAVTVDGDSLDVSHATVTSDSETSSQEKSSFEGLNAAVLAKNGATLALSCASVTTTGSGANGVFATGAGSSIHLSSVQITCSGDGAHGVEATSAGTLVLEDVEISTAGAHGAAIATDRGGGTITVTGGRVTTSGTDSPGIYSTGSVTVSGANIAATLAEAAVIDGENSITLSGTALRAAKGTRDRGVMIYQSTSGDATPATGTFTMTGGSFEWSSISGPLFYVTNSTGVIRLSGVSIHSASAMLVKASADQWGTSGNNGGHVQLTADSELLAGNVVADESSSVELTLKNGASLDGAIDAAGTAGSVDVTLETGTMWTLTADSTVTTLTDADEALGNIVSNGHSVCYRTALNGSSSATHDLGGGGKIAPCTK